MRIRFPGNALGLKALPVGVDLLAFPLPFGLQHRAIELALGQQSAAILFQFLLTLLDFRLKLCLPCLQSLFFLDSFRFA